MLRFNIVKITLFTVIISVFLMVFVSCETNNNINEQQNQINSGQVSDEIDISKDITILGGSVGGVWSAITEGVAESMRRNFPHSNITAEPGKDGPNNIMVARKEAELAISYTPTAFTALKGIDPYPEAYSDIRAVAVLNPNSTFHFLVLRDLGLTSIEDIKTKEYPLHISVNKKGCTMELASKAVLEAYGVSYQDIESWGGKVYYLSTKESMEAIDDGQVQAHSITGEHPISHFIEAATRRKFDLLPISPEAVNLVNQKLGTHSAVIPGGIYPFASEEIPTFAGALLLVTGAEQSEELIYNVVKALSDNIDYLRTVHATLKDMDLETMANTEPIPLHSGAEKYYREKGVLK